MVSRNDELMRNMFLGESIELNQTPLFLTHNDREVLALSKFTVESLIKYQYVIIIYEGPCVFAINTAPPDSQDDLGTCNIGPLIYLPNVRVPYE